MKQFLVYIVLFFVVVVAKSQTTQVEFGQNKVQYKKFNWQYLETDNYDLYYYNQSENFAKYIHTIADNTIKNLIDKLGYSNRIKFDILVFNSAEDFAQTNIGLNNETYNIGGTTKVNENKIFIYYNGNYQTFQNDLKKALVDVLTRQMMKGGSFGQKLTNFLFLRLPVWYNIGVVNYIAYGWNTQLDDALRQNFIHYKNISFNQLIKENPSLAGQSFWYMLAEEYSENSISNILYLTRINHNINTGFRLAINKDLSNLSDQWLQFYSERYQADIKNRKVFPSEMLLQQKGKIASVQTNAANNKMVYSLIKKNKQKIKVTELPKKNSQVILKNKFNSNNNFAWSKDNRLLAISYYKNGKIYIKIKDYSTKKTITNKIENLDKIYALDFSYNNDRLVLSAQKNGQTDLFQYSISSNSSSQITNDIFDQLNPKVSKWNGLEKILFSSNIPSKSIGDFSTYNFDALDLFVSDINGKNIERLTTTPNANEVPIGNFNADYFTFMSDENGINNQYIGNLSTSTISDTIDQTKKTIFAFNYNPITNFEKNIEAINVTNTSNIYLVNDVINKRKTKSKIYSENRLSTTAITDGITPTNFIASTKLGKHSNNNFNTQTTIQPNMFNDNQTNLDSIYLGNFPYTFQTKFKNRITTHKSDSIPNETKPSVNASESASENNTVEQINQVEKFAILNTLPVVSPYKSKFATDYFTTQLDNSLMNTYQSVQQNQGRYEFPSVGILLKVGVSDIMDNHRLSGAIRMPFTFDGSEIALRYDALKHRVDGHLSFYSRFNKVGFDVFDGTGASIGNYIARTSTYIADAGLSFPFNDKNALKVSGGYRNEQFTPTYTDANAFALKKQTENWINGKLEFVHDGTEEIQFNIPKGLKFKTFFEYYKNINSKGLNTYNVGFDLRYYLKIHKNLIWANRVAFASSFGTQKILYFLGGVDTWLNQKYDNNIPIDGTTNFGLQAPVNNMRGLPQNIRNGNNYLLWNSELRWPLFAFFAKKALQSDFIRDFQLIGFFDAGMAYSEANPFDKENAYRKEIINPGNPMEITLKTYRNPFVYGFGGGIRSNIMGYFIRIDAGWGHNGKTLSTKPIWHISLSKDF
ncbi:MAG TPA: hypothetical protein PKI48_05825 [Chitinophagales bacterium]|nr:hypothetical protein [Chitinophagales bacterium]